MSKTPSELTPDGLQTLLEDNKFPSTILQIISIDHQKPGIIQLILSDGFAKNKAIFCEDAAKKIENEKQVHFTNALIDVKLGFVKNSEIFVRKFEFLSEYSQQIGEPIEFSVFKSQGYINEKGNNKISAPIPSQKKSSAIILFKNQPTDQYMTLNMLSMMTEDWSVKARILRKSEKKTWRSAAKGTEGTVFGIDIVDANGTEMNCSFFNASCEKWYDLLEAGKTYIFSRGNVKLNNQKFTQKSDYQIVFEERSEIQLVDDDPGMIKQRFHFVKINKIMDLPVGSTIDVIGIVKECGGYQEVNVRNSNAPKGRRLLQIYDDSLSGIEVTMWGDAANKDYPKNSILMLKNTRTNEFNTIRNLTTTFQTSVVVDPTHEEYQRLEKWRDSLTSDDMEKISIKERGEKKLHRTKTLAQIELEMAKVSSGSDEKVFTDTKAYIILMKSDERAPMYYIACPNEKCSKKVTEDMDGYRCESCNKSFKDVVFYYY